MGWGFIVALAIAVTAILFITALVFYLNPGGIYNAIQEARKRRAARIEREKMTTKAQKTTVR